MSAPIEGKLENKDVRVVEEEVQPALKMGTRAWALDPRAQRDDQMPWLDPRKPDEQDKCFERKRRFVLYAGIISGAELVDTVRELPGAARLDFCEQRASTGEWPRAAADLAWSGVWPYRE